VTEIIAHRGARSLAPENTLAAATAAWRAGAHRWETDIQVTRDGHLVLFHDPDLLRCTNAGEQLTEQTTLPEQTSGGQKKFLLARYTLAELKTLDAGSWFEKADPFSTIQAGDVTKAALAEFKTQTIPTLAQGLLLTKQLNWQINLELKDHSTDPSLYFTVDKALADIDKSGISLQQVVISSFNHDWLNRVRHLRPDICVQALAGESAADMAAFEPGAFGVYNLNADLVDPAFVTSLVHQGFEVNLFTVNDPAAADRFIRAGAHGIITDFPQWFVSKHLCS
jgi:glycerophosphoryl diester phosphodiesterase